MQFRRLFRPNSDQIFAVMQLLISSTMLFKRHQKNLNKPINFSKIHEKYIQISYRTDLKQSLQPHTQTRR